MPVIQCPDCNRDVSTLAPACPHCGRPSPAAVMPLAQPAPAAPAAEEVLWRGTPSAVVLVGRAVGIVFALVLVPLIAWALTRNSDQYTHDRSMTISWLAKMRPLPASTSLILTV